MKSHEAIRRALPGAALVVLLGLGACAPPPRSTVDMPPPAWDEELADRAREVVRVARTHLGTPYRLGGADASGFDCSGLVVHSYRRVGVRLPRTTAGLARAGVAVPRDALRPGDLVLFAGGGAEVSHVGIWVGRDRFVHASSSRGVVEDALSTRWFRDRYVGGRRVLRP